MLKIKELSKTFGKGTPDEVQALRNINLEINAGEFVVVVGDNGSGKSTFFNCIAGSLMPDKGKITINKKEISRLNDFERAKFIGRVFQNPSDGVASDLTVSDNYRLAELRDKSKGFRFGKNHEFTERLMTALAWPAMGLENKVNALVGSLSGGQRQVLSLLMATAVNPDLLLLDEPTAALDPAVSEKVMHLSNDLIRAKNITAIMITHQLQHAIDYGDRILFMRQGMIARDVKKAENKPVDINDILTFFHR
ncbi:MAG: ABC transporter ATP-binding protein [Flavobacteriales bacterium]